MAEGASDASHTADYLRTKVVNSIDSVGLSIQNDIFAFMNDSGSNILKAVKDMCESSTGLFTSGVRLMRDLFVFCLIKSTKMRVSLRCSAHRLHLSTVVYLKHPDVEPARATCFVCKW